MAASYPTSVKSFSTKSTTDVVEASHPNDLQDEVTAIETALLTGGLAHNLIPSGTRTLGNSSTFWDKGYVTALILGAETTSGVRLDLEAGVLAVREGDDSAYAPLKALTLEATSNATVGGTLGVTGAATLSSTLAVTGATTLGDIATQSLIGAGANGVGIGATHASGTIRFYSGGTTLRGQFVTDGQLQLNPNSTTGAVGGLLVITDQNSRQSIQVRPTSDVAGGKYLGFRNAADAEQGSITATNSTTTAFNTSSDQRMKRSHGRFTDVEALRNLVIHDAEFIENGARYPMVFAQEAHQWVPEAITPGKTDADMWAADYGKFTPRLIVGWQQHDARIAALEAKAAR